MAKSQTPYYYYYSGEKQYLSLNTEYVFLSVKQQQLPDSIQQRNIRSAAFRADNSDKMYYQNRQGTNRFYTRLNLDSNLSDTQYLNLLSDMKRQNRDAIISPYFKFSNGDKVGLSNFFVGGEVPSPLRGRRVRS